LCGDPAGLLESDFSATSAALLRSNRAAHRQFELAHRGTIFLDEVGDIPLEPATEAFAVCFRTGSSKGWERPLDSSERRLVAATNRNLEEMVAARTFAAICIIGFACFL